MSDFFHQDASLTCTSTPNRTTNGRAGCGRSACPVRREGEATRPLPTSIDLKPASPTERPNTNFRGAVFRCRSRTFQDACRFCARCFGVAVRMARIADRRMTFTSSDDWKTLETSSSRTIKSACKPSSRRRSDSVSSSRSRSRSEDGGRRCQEFSSSWHQRSRASRIFPSVPCVNHDHRPGIGGGYMLSKVKLADAREGVAVRFDQTNLKENV